MNAFAKEIFVIVAMCGQTEISDDCSVCLRNKICYISEQKKCSGSGKPE